MIRPFIFLPLLVTTALSSAAPNDRFAQIILFIEEGSEPAKNYQERLNSLALRTEAFFSSELKRWKRPVKRTQIFARNEKGNVRISVVKGTLLNPAGRAALPELNNMAIKGTIHEFGHALGLPHIGPRPGRKLGNTLMGPIQQGLLASHKIRRTPRLPEEKKCQACFEGKLFHPLHCDDLTMGWAVRVGANFS